MKSKTLSIIVGIIAICIGVGYGLAALGVISSFTVFFKGWWTLFIIVPGLLMLFTKRNNRFVALCIIALGVMLLLQQNDLLGSVKKYVIPALIIIFGVSLIMNAFSPKKNNRTFIPEIPEDGSIPTFEVSFGEVKPDYAGKEFEGCSLDVTFGSCELDLRQAIINKNVTVSINTAFAGVDVILPPGLRVDLETSASFGGVENKYTSSDLPDVPVIHIYAAVSFGGITIK